VAKAPKSGKAEGEDEGAGRIPGEDLVSDGAAGNAGNADADAEAADDDDDEAGGDGKAGKAVDDAEVGADVTPPPEAFALPGGGSGASRALSFSSSSLLVRDRDDETRPKVRVSDDSVGGADGLGVSNDVGAGVVEFEFVELGAAAGGPASLDAVNAASVVVDFADLVMSGSEGDDDDEDDEDEVNAAVEDDDDGSGGDGKKDAVDEEEEEEDEVRKAGRKERSNSAAGGGGWWFLSAEASVLAGCVNTAKGTRAGDFAGVTVVCGSAAWKLENSSNSSSSSPPAALLSDVADAAAAATSLSSVASALPVDVTPTIGAGSCGRGSCAGAGVGRSGCRMPPTALGAAGFGEDCWPCPATVAAALHCAGIVGLPARSGDREASGAMAGEPPPVAAGSGARVAAGLVGAAATGTGCSDGEAPPAAATGCSGVRGFWRGDRRGGWILASTSGGSGGRSSGGTTGPALPIRCAGTSSA
jgi:hypothetical protein